MAACVASAAACSASGGEPLKAHASTGPTADPVQSTSPSHPLSTASEASKSDAASSATLYHNQPHAMLNPAAELYTPQAQSGDPASMMRYYCYGYVAPDGSMAYMMPYVPDAAPYARGEKGEPPAGTPEGVVPHPHPVPMPMPYSMPLYQRPYFYPGMGAYAYPSNMPPGMGSGVAPDTGYAALPAGSMPASGQIYPTMYDSHSHAKPIYLGPPGGYAPHLPHVPAYAAYGYAEPGASPYYGYAPNMVAPASMMGQYHPAGPAFAQNAPPSSTGSTEASRHRRSSTTTASVRSRRTSSRQNSGATHPSSTSEPTRESAAMGDDAGTRAPIAPRTTSPRSDAHPEWVETAPDAAPVASPVASPVSVPATAPAVAPAAAASEGRGPAVSSTANGVPLTGADAGAAVPNGPVSEDQTQVKRSNFVMWCGNVPSDATIDELNQFFEQIPPEFVVPRADAPSDAPSDAASPPATANSAEDVPDMSAGILSIFIMSRSNCAFVNYVSETSLERACAFFHGKPLRARPGCPRLVCRPRRLEDAEYAGVAAQRGKGVHTNWYRQQRQLQREQRREQRATNSAVNAREANDTRDGTNDSDSLSFASTNSSLLRQPLFGHRYFILKSRNAEALVTALRTNVWSTQPHNEGVLDQAFRNSAAVTLLFSENFSGQFFGYATMSSRIGGAMPHTEKFVRMASDEADQTDAVAESVPSSRSDEAGWEGTDETPAMAKANSVSSAMSSASAAAKSVTGEHQSLEELAASATHHNRHLDALDEDESAHAKPDAQAGVRDKDATPPAEPPAPSSESGSATSSSQPGPMSSSAAEQIHDSTSQLGRPFYIRWKNTKPLPFHEIQALRNPWRDNRLVKVSRDGTELEPNIGAQLLDIWDAYAQNNS